LKSQVKTVLEELDYAQPNDPEKPNLTRLPSLACTIIQQELFTGALIEYTQPGKASHSWSSAIHTIFFQTNQSLGAVQSQSQMQDGSVAIK